MGFIAVIEAPEVKVPVQELRMDIALQMLIAKTKAAKAQDHALDYARGSSSYKIVTALLFQC